MVNTKAEEGINMEHGFYSYKLNRPFKTLDELDEAEKELVEKENREKKLKEDRAKEAKEIEDLIQQKIELTNKINEKIDKFVEKYGSYHYTLKDRSLPTFFKNFFVDLY